MDAIRASTLRYAPPMQRATAGLGSGLRLAGH
jgi:hypothetical protein